MHSERFQRSSHRECWDLLPWLVNDTLTDAQRQRLELHLADCAECCREANEQRRVREHMQREESVLYAPQASLQKLLQRLDGAGPLPQPRESSRGFSASRSAKLLAAAVVIGAVTFIAMDSVSSWRLREARSAARYSTLTSKPAVVVGGPAARVVFSPKMSLAQLSDLLRTSHAQVVTGPSEAGVYTLVFSAVSGSSREVLEEQVDAAVQELRKNPDVLFAELVGTGELRTGRQP
jgi:hypothetical protein